MHKARCSRATGAAFHPAFCETLEPRLLMSGNVSVWVHDGWLEVRGDRRGNEITIDQSGLAAGQFRVSPSDGDTLIDGQSQGQLFDGVANLRVRLGGGADRLTIQNVTLNATSSQLRIDLGAGQDTLSFVNDTFYCRIIAALGRGNDTVSVDEATSFLTSPFVPSPVTGSPEEPLAYYVGPLPTFGQETPPPSYRFYGRSGKDTLLAADSTTLENIKKFFRGFPHRQVSTTTPTDPNTPSDPSTPVTPPGGHIAIDPSWTLQQQLAAENTDFAFDLYHQLAEKDGNVFFSPLSISAAMAMLYAGAGGGTADEIAQVMSFLLPRSDFAGAFGTLLNNLMATSGDNSTLDIANSMWGQRDCRFLDSYLQTLGNDFQSEMHLVNFITDPEAQRLAINQWVSDHTDDMIKDLLPPGSVDDATRLVLANAIYFSAQWEYSFDKTEQQAFHLSGGDVNVTMMEQSETYQYFDGGNFQAVEIPYVGNKSMIVLLPAAGQFDQFDSSLSAAQVQAIEDGMSSATVNLSLPKFGYEQSSSLGEVLSEMGMPDAFTEAADLSGIDGRHDLSVSDVIHKAKIEVTEKGTKAAAATVITVGATCAYGHDTPMAIFTADRPFVYLIKDNTTNSTLFVGRVSDAAAFA